MVEKLKALMAKKGWSQAKTASIVGLGASTLSEYLNGTYKGDINAIEKKVSDVLSDIEDNAVKQFEFFVDTTLSEKIENTLALLQKTVTSTMNVTGSGNIAIIAGKAGRGKTYTLKKYVAEHPGKCILIESESNYTYSKIMKEIAKQLKIATNRRNDAIKEEIIATLTGKKMIIIVDEAEHLNSECIEVLRRIADKTGVGLALVGLETILNYMRNLKTDSEYLISRIMRVTYISDIDKNDAIKILNKYFEDGNIYSEGEIEKLAETFVSVCRGSIRRMSKLLPLTMEYMKHNGKDKMTSKFVQQVKETTLDVIEK